MRRTRAERERKSAVGAMAFLLAAGACGGGTGGAPAGGPPPAPPRFDDMSARIPFSRQSWPNADGLGGLAWLDYDNDGKLDLYITNGPGNKNALFHNLGGMAFEDVTDQAGVGGGQGNSGVIAADLDNDGWVDLIAIAKGGVYTNGEGPPLVLHNKGDGTFEDITAKSGLVQYDESGNPIAMQALWSGAAADVDGDGDLDLFITAPGSIVTGTQPSGRLFRNNGDLTFTDVTKDSGLDGAALGQCAAGFSDYDNDGAPDLFVANCLAFVHYNGLLSGFAAAPVQLFRHDQGMHFIDVTSASGLDKVPGFWMSIVFADVNNDGQMDLFSTNTGTSDGHPHGLFLNRGDGTFELISEQAGVAEFEYAWGAAFTDFDNDGFADLFFIGSMPVPPSNTIGPGVGNPGRLLMNQNKVGQVASNTFVEDTTWGQGLNLHLENEFTSGVAHGDFDNDGFEDLVVLRETWAATGGSGQPLLLHNGGNGNHWVEISLSGTNSNKFGVGARVTVKAGKLTQVKEVHAGTSFASTDSARLTFGLGTNALTGVEVRWPSGRRESFGTLQGEDHAYQLVEGSGTVF